MVRVVELEELERRGRIHRGVIRLADTRRISNWAGAEVKMHCIEELLALEDPVLFPPTLHMGKIIPSDCDQCACLNKVYSAARRDPEAARCLKSNGLPTPRARHEEK